MAEYIERESVIELLNSLKERACRQGDSDAEGAFMIVRNAIGDLPGIDIVHCKDCDNCDEDDIGISRCCKFEFLNEPNAYCSYGERRCKEGCTER